MMTRTLVPRLVEGRIVVGTAAVAITAVVSKVLEVSLSGALLTAVFAATVAIYNLDRVCDPRGACSTTPHVVRGALLLSGGLLAAVLPSLRGETVIALVIGFPLCALYAIPLPISRSVSGELRRVRPKDHPIGKALFVASCVTTATVLLPCLEAGMVPTPARATFAVAWLFLAILGNAIACDLRDLPRDTQIGLRTIPSLLGTRRTRSILIASHGGLCIGVGSLVLSGVLPAATVIPCAMAPLALSFLRHHHPQYWWDLTLDGAFLPMLIVLL